jgi:hypothetical protein
LGEPVRQPDRHRHQVVGLVTRIAEHHPLVAGTLAEKGILSARALADLVSVIYTHGDVRRLLADRDRHAAGQPVEAHFRAGITDPRDHLADYLRDLDISTRGYFAGDNDQTGREEGLAGDACERVLGQYGVEDGVGNLVGHLVRMALRNRFRRKVPACHPGGPFL